MLQLEPFGGGPRGGDVVHAAQQVVVPAVVPVPNLERDLTVEETQMKQSTDSTADI